MKGRGKRNSRDGGDKSSIGEARRDLEESKQTVRKLLELRQSVFRGDKSKEAKIEEYREKAIEALNHLFEDEIRDAS